MALLPDIGTISIAVIIARLVNEFSSWQPEDLFNLGRELDKEWNPIVSSIYELLNAHENVHSIMQKNGNLMSDMAKINGVMTALKASGLYDVWYQNWKIGHSTTASRVYTDFTRDIKSYHPTIHLQTSQMGYSANASTVVASNTRVPMKSTKDSKLFYWCATHCLNHSHWSSECKSPNSTHNKHEMKPPKGWTMT
jgi:hypothetical protein